LKRKRHEEETQKQLELSQEIKKFKKGPGFDAENVCVLFKTNRRILSFLEKMKDNVKWINLHLT
jgi:hypothetical protein